MNIRLCRASLNIAKVRTKIEELRRITESESTNEFTELKVLAEETLPIVLSLQKDIEDLMDESEIVDVINAIRR